MLATKEALLGCGASMGGFHAARKREARMPPKGQRHAGAL